MNRRPRPDRPPLDAASAAAGVARHPDGAVRRRPAWLIRGYHIQGWLTATPLWWCPPPECPIDATAKPPRLPSAKARMRIPRIARARADLGDLRCADNLRRAPPAGPLVDVPFHNELRLFIGEGPLLGDMDIGSSRTQKLLHCRRRDMAFGGSPASVPAPVRVSWPWFMPPLAHH